MKEHMADYIDALYIFLEHNYGTWDPHLCHWGRSDIILYAYVYGPHGYLLTWMYKHFHDSLMRYLLDVHVYDVVMYFHDLYFCTHDVWKGGIPEMGSWNCLVSSHL